MCLRPPWYRMIGKWGWCRLTQVSGTSAAPAATAEGNRRWSQPIARSDGVRRSCSPIPPAGQRTRSACRVRRPSPTRFVRQASRTAATTGDRRSRAVAAREGWSPGDLAATWWPSRARTTGHRLSGSAAQWVSGSVAQRLSGPAGQRVMPRTEAWVAQRVRPVQETPSRCTASGRGIALTVDACRRPAPSGHARPGPGGRARPDGCHRKATGVPGRQDVAETACQRAPLPGQRDHRSAEPSALCALPPVPAPALPATAPRSSPAPVEGARPDPAHEVGAASHASRRSPEDPQVRSDSYSEDLPNVQFHHMEY